MEDAEKKIRKRHFRRPTLHNDGTLKVLLFLNVFVCKNTPGESIDGEGVTEINWLQLQSTIGRELCFLENFANFEFGKEFDFSEW